MADGTTGKISSTSPMLETIEAEGLVKAAPDENIEKPVLEPLCFPEENDFLKKTQSSAHTPLSCLLCDRTFEDTGVRKSDSLLHHLLLVHQLVIADVDVIADFKSYIQYWSKRFRESPITDICTVININTKPEDTGPKLQYNLLCDGLPEDKQIREELQFKKLQGILQCQQQERTDAHFSRDCLFCNVHFEGNRKVLFEHMVMDHGFNVGLPDNLVFVNELLDTLEEKLKNLECLYCEKSFKDRPTLKDHMRKKQHKKINPKNKEYDKYYIINYLELGKSWHDILDEDDSEIRRARDDDWGDWKEESLPVHCLFCEVVSPSIQDTLKHMKACHNFDLLKIKKTLVLNFYEEVKIVNYIRRQVYHCKCMFCKEKFDSKVSLLDHQTEKDHFKLPERKSWDQPQYFFPTFENDSLLCGLPDDDDEDYDEDGNNGNNAVDGNDQAVINNDTHIHNDLIGQGGDKQGGDDGGYDRHHQNNQEEIVGDVGKDKDEKDGSLSEGNDGKKEDNGEKVGCLSVDNDGKWEDKGEKDGDLREDNDGKKVDKDGKDGGLSEDSDCKRENKVEKNGDLREDNDGKKDDKAEEVGGLSEDSDGKKENNDEKDGGLSENNDGKKDDKGEEDGGLSEDNDGKKEEKGEKDGGLSEDNDGKKEDKGEEDGGFSEDSDGKKEDKDEKDGGRSQDNDGKKEDKGEEDGGFSEDSDGKKENKDEKDGGRSQDNDCKNREDKGQIDDGFSGDNEMKKEDNDQKDRRVSEKDERAEQDEKKEGNCHDEPGTVNDKDNNDNHDIIHNDENTEGNVHVDSGNVGDIDGSNNACASGDENVEAGDKNVCSDEQEDRTPDGTAQQDSAT